MAFAFISLGRCSIRKLNNSLRPTPDRSFPRFRLRPTSAAPSRGARRSAVTSRWPCRWTRLQKEGKSASVTQNRCVVQWKRSLHVELKPAISLLTSRFCTDNNVLIRNNKLIHQQKPFRYVLSSLYMFFGSVSPPYSRATLWEEPVGGACLPLTAKLKSTSLQVMVTRSAGLKIIVSVMSSIFGGEDCPPPSPPPPPPSLRLWTASTASSHWWKPEHTQLVLSDVPALQLHISLKRQKHVFIFYFLPAGQQNRIKLVKTWLNLINTWLNLIKPVKTWLNLINTW